MIPYGVRQPTSLPLRADKAGLPGNKSLLSCTGAGGVTFYYIWCRERSERALPARTIFAAFGSLLICEVLGKMIRCWQASYSYSRMYSRRLLPVLVWRNSAKRSFGYTWNGLRERLDAPSRSKYVPSLSDTWPPSSGLDCWSLTLRGLIELSSCLLELLSLFWIEWMDMDGMFLEFELLTPRKVMLSYFLSLSSWSDSLEPNEWDRELSLCWLGRRFLLAINCCLSVSPPPKETWLARFKFMFYSDCPAIVETSRPLSWFCIRLMDRSTVCWDDPTFPFSLCTNLISSNYGSAH